jgi:protease-4
VRVRRVIAYLVMFVGTLTLCVLAAAALAYVMSSRGPAVPERALLVLRPGGELLEVPPDDVVGQLMGRESATVRALTESLRNAQRDDRVAGVLLLPSSLDLPFWGKVQELREALLEFRQSGKPVIAFLEYGGDREYYLASAADHIFLLPTSPLDLTGVASYEVFLRGAFEKMGAYPDFVHVGAYKTAVNQFTEKGFTPEHREMTESLTRDLYDQIVEHLAEAREKNVDEVRRLFDEGPFTPTAAHAAGLVDELAYFDELDARFEDLDLVEPDLPHLEEADYRGVTARSLGLRPQARIAVLYAAGVIASGDSSYDAVNGAIVGSDTIVEQLRRIREDDTIRAVVLRVDSPGGSSVASDVIWRALTVTRDEEPSRPIVASMSDLAASGGYYISMPADVIIAQPATLTGSIGIFGGKIAIGDSLAKLGVGTETVRAGRNSTIDSPFEPFTPDQRQKLQGYMQTFYEGFVEKVASARQRTPAQIDAVAQGRVWTGRQARERGLVDMLGGLDTAVAVAKERAGIPEDEEVELVSYPPPRTFYEALVEEFGGSGGGIWSLLAGRSEARALAAVTAPVRVFRRGEPLALMPFALVR